MADSRTKNTTRNIISGLFYRCVGILLPFYKSNGDPEGYGGGIHRDFNPVFVNFGNAEFGGIGL